MCSRRRRTRAALRRVIMTGLTGKLRYVIGRRDRFLIPRRILADDGCLVTESVRMVAGVTRDERFCRRHMFKREPKGGRGERFRYYLSSAGPRDERGGLELLLGRTLLESYFIAPFTLRSIAEIVFE